MTYTRREVLARAIGILLVGGLFDAGYFCGAHAEHPNSIWTQVAFTFAAAVIYLLIGLWGAAAPKTPAEEPVQCGPARRLGTK